MMFSSAQYISESRSETYTLIVGGDRTRIGSIFVRASSGIVHSRDGAVLARDIQSAVLDLLHTTWAEEVANPILNGIRAEGAGGDDRGGTAE
jgi:hypothetical protein